MTPDEWLQRWLAVATPLAFAQEYFGFRDTLGRTVVPLDQAYVWAAARPDLWEGWPRVPRRVRELAGRYWHVREEALAGRGSFLALARVYAADAGSLYRLPSDVPPREATYVIAAHAQKPLELAEELVREAEEYYYLARAPLPVAGPGRWTFGGREPTTITIPDTESGSPVPPVDLRTAPYRARATISRRDALRTVRRQAAADPAGRRWKPQLLARFHERLTDARGRPATGLRMPAGRVTVVNAPTGVGKTVVINAVAPRLARRGDGPVAVIVGTVHDGLTTAERIRADDELVHEVAAELARTPGAAELRVVPLVSPYRRADQAERALDQGSEERFDLLAYGCDLSAWITDGPPVRRGSEPCLTLEPADDVAGTESAGPHGCPRMGTCDKYSLIRAAAGADIIVTNHHNLLLGAVPVTVATGRGVVRRMSVLEFVTTHCRVLIVDEVDHLQSVWCDTGSEDFCLANRGTAGTSLLLEVDLQREALAARADRRVVNALFKARGLGEQFLNYVLDGELWLDPEAEDTERPGSGWHVPGTWDRVLLKDLLGLDEHATIAPGEYAAFRAIFPDADKKEAFPEKFAPLARILRDAVSRDAGEDELPVVKVEIARELKRLKVPPPRRREVSNALLVRAWLGSLHKALTHLKSVVAGLGPQIPAGRELARALGAATGNGALPYGPLGYQLFGFKVDKNNRGGGRLSVQSLGGDPHTGTVQLGGTVALACAGHERSVLALSATAYFPRAARTHLHTDPAYVMTDATPGKVTARPGNVSDSDTAWNPIRIGGLPESHKADWVRTLGERLWTTRLSEHLRDLENADRDRARAMVVSNSYRQAGLLGAGIAHAVAKTGGQPSWIAVVIPKTGLPPGIALPPGVVTVTVDRLEDLPRTHPHVKIVCAPLPLVARALNILVPGTDRSAITSIWVGLRPVADLHSPKAMYASINAAGVAAGRPGPDPAHMLALQNRAARRRLHALLRSDPRFSRLPPYLKTEILAGILVDLIQLAGRARRGDTPVQLYLVDNAFFDTRLGSDFPALVRAYFDELTDEEQKMLRRVYGSTLTAWLDLAHSDEPANLTHVPLPRETEPDHESVR
ncbi:hypothetical protein B4N89_45280 [Embleya scabrispora]|uniref:AAA+ ATPase domain-containing protein n=1 Tax=Embleya scabrispora TaxID=159449 RepID=A0A1T3NIT2_9ACTN|nr:hypothetical protein [Embleya scabrispora]OPC76702.1 hypothetical protein B4N89_45280 [Embleya scabrispora]